MAVSIRHWRMYTLNRYLSGSLRLKIGLVLFVTSVASFCFYFDKLENLPSRTNIKGFLKTVKTMCLPEEKHNFLGRVAQLHHSCLKSKAKNTTARLELNSTLNYLSVVDEQRFIYCTIPKVASTSLKTAVALIAGKHQQLLNITDIHTVELVPIISNFSEPERQRRLRSYFKFLFVRHPFPRLVSAYRDKLTKPNHYYRSVGEQILSISRNRSVFNISSEIYPTFSEFINFLIITSDTDVHWETYQSLCSPCLINYNYVGKFETLAEDFLELLQIVAPDKDIKLPLLNPTDKHNLPTKRSQKLELISSLTYKQRTFLLEHYSDDLDMFGYGWDEERQVITW